MTSPQDKFRLLQEKSKKIIEGAIQINTKIESAKENHQKLAAMAEEKYGSSDIVELKKMLEDWQEDNNAQVEQYQKSVEDLEKEVNEKSEKINSIKQAAN